VGEDEAAMPTSKRRRKVAEANSQKSDNAEAAAFSLDAGLRNVAVSVAVNVSFIHLTPIMAFEMCIIVSHIRNLCLNIQGNGREITLQQMEGKTAEEISALWQSWHASVMEIVLEQMSSEGDAGNGEIGRNSLRNEKLRKASQVVLVPDDHVILEGVVTLAGCGVDHLRGGPPPAGLVQCVSLLHGAIMPVVERDEIKNGICVLCEKWYSLGLEDRDALACGVIGYLLKRALGPQGTVSCAELN
jgi:hypothetical protein